MGWRGLLELHYRLRGGRTVAQDRHEGPLRVLRALHPEGPAICHHVLVHPPGGIAGGDALQLRVTLETGAHALITTPGASRYYRTAGPLSQQRADLYLAPGARLEWLPLENIAYPGCKAENIARLHLAKGAQAIGWDMLALGLPASAAPFDTGRFVQHLEFVGAWRERGTVDAADRTLLESPLGWAGRSVLATAWFASGDPLPGPLQRDLVEAAHAALAVVSMPTEPAPVEQTSPTAWGVTAPQASVVVARVLAHRVEPALKGLMAVRSAWRRAAWELAPLTPRIWHT